MTKTEHIIHSAIDAFCRENSKEPNILLVGTKEYNDLYDIDKIRRCEDGDDRFIEYEGLRIIRVYKESKLQIGYVQKLR